MRRSLFFGLFLAAAALASAAPASAQAFNPSAEYPGWSLPPEARFAPGTFVPTSPDAFDNESDEKGYSSGDPENPPSN